MSAKVDKDVKKVTPTKAKAAPKVPKKEWKPKAVQLNKAAQKIADKKKTSKVSLPKIDTKIRKIKTSAVISKSPTMVKPKRAATK